MQVREQFIPRDIKLRANRIRRRTQAPAAVCLAKKGFRCTVTRVHQAAICH